MGQELVVSGQAGRHEPCKGLRIILYIHLLPCLVTDAGLMLSDYCNNLLVVPKQHIYKYTGSHLIII